MPAIDKVLATAAILSMTIVAPIATPATAAENGVKAGFLKCDVAGSVSFVFGSSRDIRCVFDAGTGKPADNYAGTIKKYGVDIGYQSNGVMVWAVLAPTNDVGPGALAGGYAGISAAAAIGYGVGANALLGGSQDSFVLQPLSVEGIQGLNIAGGVAVLTLQAAN